MAHVGFSNLGTSQGEKDCYAQEVKEADQQASMSKAGEYYSGPARWLSLSNQMAQDGEAIQKGEIEAAFEGHAPKSFAVADRKHNQGQGTAIATNLADTDRKTATDMTVSNTKSFSALVRSAELAGEAELAMSLRQLSHNVIRDTVHHAVDIGLIRTRRGHGGREIEKPVDLLIAVVPHAHSRLGDPQEHNHVLFFNGSLREDKSVGTLDLSNLVTHKFYLQALVNAGMAERLQKMGFAVEETGCGQWELAGRPEKLIDIWSRRRKEVLTGQAGAANTWKQEHELGEEVPGKADPLDDISADQRARDRSGTQARREAHHYNAIKTRYGKHTLRPLPELEKIHRQELKEADVTAEGVISAMRRASMLTPVLEGSPAEVGVEALFERTSVATMRQFRTAVAEAASARGVSVAGVEAEVQRAMTSGLVKSIGLTERGETVVSTDKAIQTERAMLVAAQAGRGQGKLTLAAAEKAITVIETRERVAGKAGFTLAEEQRDAVRWAARGDQFAVIEGLAGTGKTTSMQAVVLAAQMQGMRTIGVAPMNTASETLWKEAHTDEYMSLQKLSADVRSGKKTLNARDYILVDEAGMAELGHVATITEAARKAGAQVLYIGDERQFAPIGAGAPFAALGTVLGTSRLAEIRRQRVPWQNAASRKMALGDTEAGLMAYAAEGRWKFGRDRSDAMSALVTDWTEDLERPKRQGDDTAARIVIAQRHVDAHELNARLRGVLIEKGELGDEEITVKTLRRDGRDGEKQDLALRAGDELIVWRKVPEHNLNNGDRITVVGFKPVPGSEESDVLLTWKVQKTGVEVTAPLSSLVPPAGPDDPAHLPRLPFLQHAYAVSMYASQGKTVDQGFVYGGTGLDMRSAYVSMTRHRDDARIYWDRAGIAQELVDRGEKPTSEAVVDHIRREARRSDDKYNVLDFVPDVDAWLKTGDLTAERTAPSATAARMQAAEQNAIATVQAAAQVRPDAVRAIAASLPPSSPVQPRRAPRVSPQDRATRAYDRAVSRSQGQAAAADRRALNRFENILGSLQEPGGFGRFVQSFKEVPRRLGRQVSAIADRVAAAAQWREAWSARQAAQHLDVRRKELDASQGRGGVTATVQPARPQPAVPEPKSWRDTWLHRSGLGRHAPETRTLPMPVTLQATLAARLPPLPEGLAARMPDQALAALARPKLGTDTSEAAQMSVRAYADALERERLVEQQRVIAGVSRWSSKPPDQVRRELDEAMARPQALRHDDLRAGVERLKALTGARDLVEKGLAEGRVRPGAPIQALDPAASPTGWLVALRKAAGSKTDFSPRPDPATDRKIFDGRQSTVGDVLALLRARQMTLGTPQGAAAPAGSAPALIAGAIGTLQEAISDGRLSVRAPMRAVAPSEPNRWRGALQAATAATTTMAAKTGRGGAATTTQLRAASATLQAVEARDGAARMTEAKAAAAQAAAAQAMKAATAAANEATKPARPKASSGPSMGMRP